MRIQLLLASVSIVLAAAGQVTSADQVVAPTARPLSPQFETLKSLVGNWEATSSTRPDQKIPMTFRVGAGQTVVVQTVRPGEQGEMFTVFHPDRSELRATHFCSSGTQPRLKAVASADPTVIRFEFVDVTNLADPNSRHLRTFDIHLIDSGHHVQEWNWIDDGKLTTATLDVRRTR